MLLGVSALGVAAFIASILRIGPALRLGPVPQSISGKIIPVTTFAQDDNDDSGDDASANKGASLEQIEKYVAVYRAMQRNHSLTVEQAATAQGLTMSAFRDLEQRISSDERSRDTARRALAAPAPSPTPAAPTPKMRR